MPYPAPAAGARATATATGSSRTAPLSIGRVREFWGNVPQVVKAYSWARAMGAEGIRQAADLSVLANNYMEPRLLAIRGVSKSYPQLTAPRLEMTRYSLAKLTEETGVTVVDVQNRMVDFGVDAFWLSHEPWIVPEPFTPEAGETVVEGGHRLLDRRARAVIAEAYEDPDVVKTAPHRQAVHQLDPRGLEALERWATTWRAYRRKRAEAAGVAALR